MRRRSPQEKKQLSYTKDRRNSYGENDKSSRKNIPRRKKAPHRANRRRASQVLDLAVGGDGETAELRLLSKRLKSWQKYPDAPLGEVVQDKLEERIRLAPGKDATRDAERVQRVRRRLRLPSI
ncbi:MULTISPECIES: hypothetical protein [unclassified Nonomuraea]|uniref:hypothetical protein n=1 Tax=unclassified Nonomuraea TaxID=2593643 RepID=UPI0033F375B3